MKRFTLSSSMTPTGDQPEAIDALVKKIIENKKDLVLVGVTGSGKTFTMANVIERVQRPTLIISHNKTLAAQLYQEFRDFFPENAVSYFVSYYDYYQPESYLPASDTYIEKETQINEEIDKLRLAATANILTRPDAIVVASVSCIYNIGSPREYGHFALELKTGMKIRREDIITRLVQLQYARNAWEVNRGLFRVRGETIDVFPAYEDQLIRLELDKNVLKTIAHINPTTGDVIDTQPAALIYPAKHYMTDPTTYKEVFKVIQKDMEQQVALFKSQGKLIEAQRIYERVTHDLEMIAEVGYTNGIENYSRYFDGRKPGDAPFTLLDYFEEATKDTPWLLFIDESHMTVPQIRGMYNGDRSRKQTLVDYGFRLPSAMDNRPLTFDEFLRRRPQTVYVSATPDDWELSRADTVAEQLVRPTGLLDPIISIRPAKGQIADLEMEIQKRVKLHERVIVTTLTKQMAEDLTTYLKQKNILVEFIHSDVLTMERTAILANLRKGKFDVIIGVNLLREGLDLPEVSLVAILDADKEGFLRSRVSLIQTMGRAARHIKGTVILYADVMTKSITAAVNEVERRRSVQETYNKKYHITPTTIQKPIRMGLIAEWTDEARRKEEAYTDMDLYTDSKLESMTPLDKDALVKKMRSRMQQSAKNLKFEEAMQIRDFIRKIKS
ncbi:MAG: excinuclease ABC subunit UvrB [Microgenomates group bacterium]